MENSPSQQYEHFIIQPDSNGTVVYPNGIKYTGEWKNGLKVGKGILEDHLIRFEVKIKDGNINKYLRVINISQSINNKKPYKFELPNIRIVKEKNSYKEEFSYKVLSYFVFIGNYCLFDGKHYSYYDIILLDDIMRISILQLTQNKIMPLIMELNFQEIRFIGPCLFLNPNGICKIIIRESIYKGNMKGIFNIGILTIKNGCFKALIDVGLKEFKYPIKVISKELGFEISLNYSVSGEGLIPGKNGKNLEIAYSCFPEILNFIIKSTMSYYHIIKGLSHLKFGSFLISCCLLEKLNWKSFEYDLKYREKMFDFSQVIIKESIETDEKCFKLLQNKERFEGKVINGKFEGFGKYFYGQGSVYVGEFRNNLKNGFGIFKFKDGRLYRGYWVNDMMHGRGVMINGKIKIHGQWDKNVLIQGSLCGYIEI